MNMFTFTATFCCLLFWIIICLVYFSKRNMSNLENKIYSYMVILDGILTIFSLVDIIAQSTKDGIKCAPPWLQRTDRHSRRRVNSQRAGRLRAPSQASAHLPEGLLRLSRQGSLAILKCARGGLPQLPASQGASQGAWGLSLVLTRGWVC